MMNHTNDSYIVISRAFYTIQAVDDVAIYQAELTSSAGELITPGTFSTKIKLTVYNNFQDITNSFTDIVWKKYIFEGNNPVEEKDWGNDKYGQREITVLREEYTKKTRIECLVYSEIDGTRTIVASDYITMVDVNDLNPSTKPPENPKEGEVWLDTSVTPPVFKVFLNNEWVVMTEDLDPIYKDLEKLLEDIGKINNEIFNINQELGSNTLLNIDNKKDFLFMYDSSLTSTAGLSPMFPYKATITNDGKFNKSVLVSSNTDNKLVYTPTINNTKSFSINMWIKPSESIISNNSECRLISTCDVMTANLICIYNASPTITDSNKKRFIAEFGNDDSGVRQFKELIHNDSFSTNEFEMFTITLDINTKEFKFYRNGEFWTSYIAKKINIPEEFSIKRAGFNIENLCILNDKVLGLSDIKTIYDLNKPFRDMLPKDALAPNPKDVLMTID